MRPTLCATLLAAVLLGCGGDMPGQGPGPGPDAAGSETFFAVIGDFGSDDADELAVSRLVAGWAPHFVVTTGDNNYGTAADWDRNVGKYYASFIGNYRGAYGPGSPTNRFFPSLGNHDWDARPIESYLEYFSALPGNRRYYELEAGLVHLFIIDSDPREPDGVGRTSVQAEWLRGALAASRACHKLVFFHHTPYGSAGFQVDWMRWPFKEWGADAVITGHEHTYERLDVAGMLLIINGLGGAKNRFPFVDISPFSQVRYNADFGAMQVRATRSGIRYEFYTHKQQRIDEVIVAKECMR